MVAALNGLGLFGIIALVLIVLGVLWLVRDRRTI